MRRAPASVLAMLLALALPGSLTACSITITSTSEPTTAASASAPGASTSEATPEPSQSAIIDQALYDFCVEEATGSLDFISMLGEDANDAIAEGIAQSIAGQQMVGAQAEACKQAWIETLATAGVTYDESAVSAP